MDFTEIYKQSASLVCFSPGTRFLLTAIQDRLVIRHAETFQIIRTWAMENTGTPTSLVVSNTAAAKISTKGADPSKGRRINRSGGNEGSASGNESWVTHAGWSCDSEYVIGACAKSGFVEVFQMRDDAWRTRIDAGAEGLTKVEWASDGRSIVCWSEWGLRVTIWSLVTGVATYIQYPAHIERGHAFRSDGHYLILAERHKSRDTLGVYDAEAAYRLVRHFPLPTSSLAGLSLSPSGGHVAVWENSLEYMVHILSLAGDVLGTFTPERDPGFGVRTVAWHPAGLYLAVLGWDDKVHVLENLTWSSVVTFDLQSRVPGGVAVWREPDKWLEATHGRGFLSYERIQSPHSLTLAPRDRTKPPPELAVGSRASTSADHIAWNADGSLLLVRYGSAPDAVWLYSFPQLGEGAASTTRRRLEGPPPKPKLRTVLVHASPVASARWNPVRRGSLAICCGGGALYMWSDEWVSEDRADDHAHALADSRSEGEEVAECVGVPAKKFATHSIRWAPDGRGLILMDRETFCCAFEVEDADDVESQTA